MKPWYRTLTRAQWLVLGAAWFGWVFDIMDSSLFAFAKVPMMTEMLGGAERYKLIGPAVEGRIQMWFLFGWAIGGFVFGRIADRFGRTTTLIWTVLLYSALTGLTALCHTPEQVLVMRFLTALGIGGEWAAGASLVAESVPDAARRGASSLLQSAAAFGPVFGAMINLGNASFHGSWRALFLVGIIPALGCVLVRRFVLEPERTTVAVRSDLSVFRTNPWRRNLIIASIIGIVGVTGAGTVPFWLPNLVKAASVGSAPEVLAQRTSWATMSLHVGTLAGVFVAPFLADRIGRKSMLGAFFLACPLSVYFLVSYGTSFARLLCLLPLGSFFTIGVSAGFVLFFPELFPSSVRATGCGIAYNMGRVVSAPVPALVGQLINSMHGNVGAGVLAASAIYGVGLLAIPFAPETKGKPLPD